MNVSKLFLSYLYQLKSNIDNRVENFGAQYVAFGIFGVLNYPIFYLIWSYGAKQSYESLFLRSTATIICIPLLLKNYLPKNVKTWLPIYWYFTLTFCMPFFFGFMLFKNNASPVWLMSTCTIFYWLVLLVDWISYIGILSIGIFLAFVCYYFTTPHPFQGVEYSGYLPQYIGSILVVLLFAYNKEAIEKTIHHYFERIIVSMPGNVFWVDRNSTILGCNENMAQMFNRKCSDMIGKNYEELILSIGADIKEYEIAKQQDKEVMSDGKAMLNVEQVIYNSQNNKTNYFLTSRVPLLDDKRNIVGVLGISIDVTKEKQAEKAKDDFISNMEHDLRTPFSGIGGIADMLYHKATDPETKKLLEIMVNSCNQWEQIHHRIFDAVILENESPPTLESFYIKDELDKIASMMMATLHVKNLQLIIDCPPVEEIGKIYNDPIKIHLILLSIIGNAIKFTEQGSITVKVRQVADQLVISVKDTGIGIPTDKLDYIFEKFAKIERSNQYGNKFQGAGLGLYISRKYAGLIGGHISVKSTAGVGSEFIFSLLNSSERKSL